MTAATIDGITGRGGRDFEVVGRPESPVVVVLGGISASCHLTPTPDDSREGWWPGVVGPGNALDPSRFRLVGVEYVTPEFGAVTTEDQARVVAQVLDQLGVSRAHAVVGASYGGMVALAFGSLFPGRAQRLVVFCAAHQSDPMATAYRIVQRRILRLGLRAGLDSEALALARSLGCLTYRTPEEFAGRFGAAPTLEGGHPRFAVEPYLDHQGAGFAARFSPARYLKLSESLDLHRVDPARLALPVTLVGSRSDAVVPWRQVRELAQRIGGPVDLRLLDAPTGHDAFLTEQEAVSRILITTLNPELPHATQS